MSEASFEINSEKQLSSLRISSQSNSNQCFNNYGQNVKTVSDTAMEIGNGVVRGLKWRWICSNDTSTSTTTSETVFSSYIQLTWDQETMKGAEGLHGSVKFTLDSPGITPVFVKNVPFRISYSGSWIGERSITVVRVDDASNTPNVPNRMHLNQNPNSHKLNFKLTCLPIFPIPDESKILKNFAKTEATDAALLIGGKTIHVNRSFLSFHSKYFEKLFTSEYKEQKSEVIEIKDVALDDFIRLLSLIYPDAIEPTVEKVDRYLQLADMYLMPAATRQCEKFLQNCPRVKDIRKIVLADKYGLDKLLKYTLLSIDNQEDLKALTRLPEFSTLGNDTTAAFMERFMHFL